jgi:serine/threonine protein kinase/peroxiredoxin
MDERMIFSQALEKESAAERAAYLAEACGGDIALQERVELLLQSHQDAGSFLATPALGQAAVPDATPENAAESHPTGGTGRGGDIALDFLVPPHRPDSVGRLDHYEVLEIVGHGGMGVVLRAFDEKLHRVVALKAMAREIAGSAAARKRFSREAKAAGAVVHDHIVPIHAIEDTGPVPYLVMQFIDGKSLQQKIDDEGSLELTEILRIGMQIASGLAAAHRQGLVHRDIKPANILLENGVQRVKITDFGLARAVDDASVSQSGVVAGTPQYMSPEQADGKLVDRRSDLFSLGSVLYAMCTGRPPFRASSTLATLKRVCEDTPRPIRELNPDIPDWLASIITKLHARKPENRFQSAKEVCDLLQQHLAHLQQPSVITAPATLVAPKETTNMCCTYGKRTRSRWVTAAIALAALVLFSAWIYMYVLFATEKTMRLEILDPDVVVTIDGDDSSFIVTSNSSQDVRLLPGRHRFRIMKGTELLREEVLFVDAFQSETRVITIEGEPHDPAAAQADAGRLQGHWKGIALQYIGGPALGPDALPLTYLDVEGKRLNLRLPGMDTGFDFDVEVAGRSRKLVLNGTASTNTFRIDRPVMEYALQDGNLHLRIDGPQPPVEQDLYRQQGLPIPTPENLGLEIVLKRDETSQIGKVAPQIVGEDLNGKPFRLSNHRGNVVVIDFWADWSPFCRQMYAWKSALSKRLAGRPFILVGISCDDASASAKKALQHRQVSCPCLWDGQRVVVPGRYTPGPIASAYQVDSLPTLFIIDQQGIIRSRQVGMDVAKLDNLINQLLEEIKP